MQRLSDREYRLLLGLLHELEPFVRRPALAQMLPRLRAQAGKSLPSALKGLTSRETDVLDWVAKGKTNAEVAAILKLSTRTIEKHLEHIFVKLGVETRTAAARLALENSAGMILRATTDQSETD